MKLALHDDGCCINKYAYTLRGFPPIATKRLGITTNLGAIGGFYGTETVIRL